MRICSLMKVTAESLKCLMIFEPFCLGYLTVLKEDLFAYFDRTFVLYCCLSLFQIDSSQASSQVLVSLLWCFCRILQQPNGDR